jgi:hypothetical protein
MGLPTKLNAWLPEAGLIRTVLTGIHLNNPKMWPSVSLGTAIPFLQYELNARGFTVEVGSDGKEAPFSTFALVLAPSGFGKSGVADKLNAIRKEAMQAIRSAHEPYRHEGQIPIDGTTAGVTDGLIARYDEAQDITPAWFFTDEIAKAFGGMQNRSGRSADLPEYFNSWLSGTDGGRLLKDNEVMVRNPRISGLGYTVIKTLKDNGFTEGIASGGFLARCMVLLDDAAPSMGLDPYERPRFPLTACVEEYGQWLLTLDHWQSQGETVFRVDRDARKMFSEQFQAFDARISQETQPVGAAMRRLGDKSHAVAGLYAAFRGSRIIQDVDMKPALALVTASIEALRTLLEEVAVGAVTMQVRETTKQQESALRALDLVGAEGLAPANFVNGNRPKSLKGAQLGTIATSKQGVVTLLEAFTENGDGDDVPLVTQVDAQVWGRYRVEVLKKKRGRPSDRYFLTERLPAELKVMLEESPAAVGNVFPLSKASNQAAIWQHHKAYWDEQGWGDIPVRAKWKRLRETAFASGNGTFEFDGEVRKWPMHLEPGSLAKKANDPRD